MVSASPVRPNPVSGPAGEGGAGPVTALLTTDRLALREFTAADAPLLTGLDAGPKVLRHLTGGRANPRRRSGSGRCRARASRHRPRAEPSPADRCTGAPAPLGSAGCRRVDGPRNG
ncbi:hypothetical protein GCM10023176_06990 [Micromonospora coerulea]|uniref:N-acetyltransferase domain-containing protein n=1 Tax=Micromonospora coerulea TaxID=47856 RepID=A0ABP8S8G9_9ACTN